MEAGQLNNLRVGFIIQARMQSARLPGKIMMPIPFDSNKNTLDWIIDGLNRIQSFDKSIYIATSVNEENDIIETYCSEKQVLCFRGDEENVLSRYTQIISKENFDLIVRLTGDNPIIDIEILKDTILEHLSSRADYSYTRGLPLGMNLEIITAQKLLNLENYDLSNSDREHVTAYFKKDPSYIIEYIYPIEEKDLSHLRLTIDYPSDFLVVSAMLSIGNKEGLVPGLELVNFCLREYPWIFELNQDNFQKAQFRSLTEEIKAVKPVLNKLEMHRLLKRIQDYDE